MPSRWFNVAIVLFWLATMTWLSITKILPPLRIGEPPNYRAIIERDNNAPPVCWSIHFNDEVLGWAATRVEHRPDEMTAMQGRVFLTQLPLDELTPTWLSGVIKPLLRNTGTLSVDARNQLDIDPLGRLVSFESRVQIAKMPDAIRIHGQVEGTVLRITVKLPDLVYKDERYLPPNAFVGNELLPQAVLPGLHVGQTWTMPVYSPFRPHKSPMEVLQAQVERHEAIVWNATTVNTLVVVYRTDSGNGLDAQHKPRGKLWVRNDGLVLRQEMTFFNSPLSFLRLPPNKTELVARELNRDWNAPMPQERAQELLDELLR
jgi:hypothetical protein